MKLFAAFLAQVEVVEALILRETRTRFGAHQLGYFWAFVEPAMWIGTFLFLYAVVGREAPPGMELVSFLLTGLLPFSVFRATVSQVSQAIASNKAMLFYPQVNTWDIVGARTILELATCASVLFAFLLGQALSMQAWPTFHEPLEVALGFLLATGLGSSLGLVFCGLGVFSKFAERVRDPLMRPMFWCSGLFFTANSLPSGARDILLYNPMLHVVEFVRDGWFPSYQARYLDVSYPCAWILGLAILGAVLERAARRKIEVT
ncbi:ABC transporter permease [Haliangium ochraceum]|uniref:Transport permease protein n=1 Tax=Haliangium ochraceum (strain DSM 14365 / JCM 11303 / SMP-2) TaxID=502025 RepID=D0LJS3_HALO1|nr:ABC transporter permease [Haliangium ochraceum]ACY18430.1 ABC-2 type transporter [Haliangium ochraceum DSM 14365]